METIQSIKPLWDSMPIWPQEKKKELGDMTPVFADVFRSAIQQVRETDAAKNKAEYLLATGQLDNPAVQSIASSKAQASLDMLIQLRNKALDAYSELSRMSV